MNVQPDLDHSVDCRRHNLANLKENGNRVRRCGRMLAPAALFLLSCAPIWACTCVGPLSPCHAAGGSVAVFVGTVHSISEDPLPSAMDGVPAQAGHDRPLAGNRASASRLALRMDLAATGSVPRFRRAFRTVGMQILETFGGNLVGGREIEIATGLGGGDCGYAFERGASYLVYAFRNGEGRLETNICTRTREIANASEDLAYLRANASSRETAMVEVATGAPGVPALANNLLVLERGEIRYLAETNGAGTAVFPSVPPGEYIARLDADGGSGGPSGHQVVRVLGKGCVTVSLIHSLRIEGRVFTADGQFARRIEVQARRADENNSAETSSTTGDDGRFELKISRPGRYQIGVNLNNTATRHTPYPRWFHPGTPDADQATVIVFDGKPGHRTLDFSLAEPLRTRLIKGTAVMPDGRPAPLVRLTALDSSGVAVAQGIANNMGGFELEVFAGTSYRLHAVWPGDAPNEAVSSSPVSVIPGTVSLFLKLVLTEHKNTYLEELQSRKPDQR